jgi:DNA-binding NtrC family response regulator
MPALREHRDDVFELAHHFLDLYGRRCGKAELQFEDDVLEVLKAYSWPGNVRELENVIERAVVLADGASITLNELPREVLRSSPWHSPQPIASGGSAQNQPVIFSADLPEAEWSAQQEQAERQRLTRALAEAHGNKARAARMLGMPRSTFVSKLEKYGLVPRAR